MHYALIRWQTAVFTVLVVALTFCSSSRAEITNLYVKGSTTILPIARDIAEEFERQCDDVKVHVSGGGSGEGILALILGEADVATSSSFITREEIRLAQQRDIYPVPFRIANDCILPVVHISNPLKDISSNDLRDIYLGLIRNWKQLGGPDLAINAISRDTASGTFEVWHNIVMGREAVASARPAKHSNAEVVEAVSANPGAIGYISLGYLNAHVKPLKVDGVMGSRQSLLDGSYLINRPLFMFTNSWPQGRNLEFINFVLDPSRGQVIIEEAGYVPLK